MKNIELSKPLILFDIESTGLNVVLDRIIQIGAIKMFPEGNTEEKNILINPGMPIPPESTEIHSITDEMVKDKPRFSNVAKSMLGWFRGCDLGGHNICGFDIPILAEEFTRCGITFPDESINFIDTLKIERMVNSHKLEDCYFRYTMKRLGEDAHDALADSRASMEVFIEQTETHDLPSNMADLEAFSNDGKKRVDFAGKLELNDDGVICYAFGNSRGVPVVEDPGFGRWILSKDFPANTKKWVKTILSI
jgi:DNA polymerase-3 subunit epsilon